MGYRPLDVDLAGRHALVAGANSGMGKETARELARMGAQVILACRSGQRAEAARHDIVATTGSTGVAVMEVDLSSLPSVRACAHAFHDRFPKLDVLVNNAAASLPGPRGHDRRLRAALGDQRARPASADHAAAASARGERPRADRHRLDARRRRPRPLRHPVRAKALQRHPGLPRLQAGERAPHP
jgi:hypothetical protein